MKLLMFTLVLVALSWISVLVYGQQERSYDTLQIEESYKVCTDRGCKVYTRVLGRNE